MNLRIFSLALLASAGLSTALLAQTSTDENEGAQLRQDQPTTGAYTFSWWGRAGRTYFIQQSEDLRAWNYLPFIEPGAEQAIQWALTSTATRLFVRLRYSDLPTDDPFNDDFDGDGVSNWDELLRNTDPLSAALDTNGLPLDWEKFYNVPLGTDPNSLAQCGNGITYLQAFQQGINPNDYYNGAVTSIAIVDGGDQRGAPGTVLPIPLSVQVNPHGDYGYPVTLSVTQGGALLSATGVVDPNHPPSANLTVSTTSTMNVAGGGTVRVAQAFLFLPNTPNNVSQIKAVVQKARPDGPTVTTSATATDPTLVPPSNLTVQISNDQTTATLQWTPGNTSKATTIETSLDGGIDWLTVGSVAVGVNSTTIIGLNPDTIQNLSFRVYTASGNPPTGGTGAGGAFVMPSGGGGVGGAGAGGGTGGTGGGNGSTPSTPNSPTPPPALPSLSGVDIDIPDVDAGVSDPDYSKVNIRLYGSSQGATDYIVERNQDGGSWTPVADLSAGTAQFSDSNLLAGCVYRYRVSAKNTVNYSAPVYSSYYRIPLVKKISVRTSSQAGYNPGFAEFIPSTSPKRYVNQTETDSYDSNATYGNGDPGTFEEYFHEWDTGYVSKATVNTQTFKVTYQGTYDYHYHLHYDQPGIPHDVVTDEYYDTHNVVQLPDRSWSGTYTKDNTGCDVNGQQYAYHSTGTNLYHWIPVPLNMTVPTATKKDYDFDTTTETIIQTGSGKIQLDTEFTVGQLIQTLIAALPAYQDADWQDAFIYQWYNTVYASSDPEIQVATGGRYLSGDKFYFAVDQSQYRFTLRPAVPGTTLAWLEVFIPYDDPTTSYVDESQFPEVIKNQTTTTTPGQTGNYTIDITKPQNIEDPTRSGTYAICVPTVDLDVNDTDNLTDDVVVKQKPANDPSYRDIPIHGDPNGPANKPGGIAGRSDNAVPLRVTFNAIKGLSANVSVTVQSAGGSGGNAVLVKQDGSAIPAGGIPLVAGFYGLDTVELLIQGTHESAALGDVTIVVTSDVTGSAILAKRNITVIWVNETFRGSAPGDQDQAFDPTSECLTNVMNPSDPLAQHFVRRVGIQHYDYSYRPAEFPPDADPLTFDAWIPQLEIKGTPFPTAVIPDVSWNFEQEATDVQWGQASSATYLSEKSYPIYEKFTHGKTDWALDTVLDRSGKPTCSNHQINADLVQEINAPNLFYMDGPHESDDPGSDQRYSRVDKFRTWMEIQIGGKWYVCSSYKPWRAIIHLMTNPTEEDMHLDPAKKNEVLQDWLQPSMNGFATDFIENP